MIEQRVRSDRADLLRNVRIVARAPRGSAVKVLPQEVYDSTGPESVPIRVTDDPKAPAYRVIDHNKSHPYGTTKLQQVINARLEDTRVNWFDLKAVRRVHGIDSRPEFHYVNLYGWSQFSPEYVEWLIDEFKKDPEFFPKARAAEKTMDSARKVTS